MEKHTTRAGVRLRLAFLITAVLAAGLAWGQPANAAFSDVPAGRFFETPVNWAAEEGITTGRTATIFDPDADVTRGEVATFVWRFAFEPAAASSSGFSDVPAGRFFSAAIDWMAETEITTGRTATIFDPDAPVTRGEVVTFLWRFMCEPTPSEASGFTDVPAGRFYTTPVAWAAEIGVTTGRTATIFDPDAPVTRGEVVTFIHRLAGNPAVGSEGDNRVTLAPDCDGTPPPPPPGVGALSVDASIAFGDLGINVGDSATITLTNNGASGGPRLTITDVESSDAALTTDFAPTSLEPGESQTVTVELTPDELGAISETLTVKHAGSNGPTETVAVTATAVPGAVHQINAGGPAVGDWTGDAMGAPSEFHNLAGSGDITSVKTDPITGNGSVPAAVYQSMRTDQPSNKRMEWDLPVPAAGYYRVTLHFAEIEESTPHRLDVELEGETVMRNFRPFDYGGRDAAVTRSFIVEMTESDTNVDIDFDHTVGLRKTIINGIQVEALGTSPDGFVMVSPALADAGSVATSGGTTDVEVTVTNFGSTSVSIPSIAPTGDFSSDKSSLTVPAGGSGSFTVTFDPSTDGVQTQWLELNSTSGDNGVQLVGNGGSGVGATVAVLESFSVVDATIIDPGAIIITNTSATARITSITFDLSGALVSNLRFDAVNGSEIAVLEQDFSSDFSPIEIASQSGTDGDTYTVTFTGFSPGQTLFGSIDIDPLSTTNEDEPGFPKAATVNGLELVGATVDITFSSGGSRTATLWNDGVHTADAFGFTGTGSPGGAPVISMAGTAGGGADGDGGLAPAAAAQTIDVTCAAGETLTLVQAEGEILIVGGATGTPTIGGNRLFDLVDPDGSNNVTTCGGGGTASFDLDTVNGGVGTGLVDTTPGDATDGWNHFMVLQGDPSTGEVTASNRLSVQLQT